jgi:PEP-CTERM motif
MCTILNRIRFDLRLIFRMTGTPSIHLRRIPMKSRPAFLICAALLLAAFSVRADSLFYTGVADESPKADISATGIRSTPAKFAMPATAGIVSVPLTGTAPVWGSEFVYLTLRAESPDTAISTKTIRGSVPVPDAAQNDAQPSDPTPAMVSIGSFGPDGAFAGRGAESSLVVGTFFPSSSDRGVHTTAFTEFDSHETAFAVSDGEYARLKIGREHRRDGDGKNLGTTTPESIAVPEPGAFPLLLFGLAAVGICAWRRSVVSPAA